MSLLSQQGQITRVVNRIYNIVLYKEPSLSIHVASQINMDRRDDNVYGHLGLRARAPSW